MLWNAFNLAQREIRRNVLRSSLTTLGIIIGVSAVIIMVTLGNGATAAVTADIANLGSNLLTVMPGQRMGPGGASGSAKPFKQRDVDFLRRDVTSVGAVAPVSSQGMSAVVGNKNRSITVTGTTNEYFTSGGWQLASGRFFNDSELRSGSAVCVVGETVRKELFGTAEVVGERLRLRAVSCEVIGLLQSKGKNPFGMDRDDVVVMPVRTFQRRLSGQRRHQPDSAVRPRVGVDGKGAAGHFEIHARTPAAGRRATTTTSASWIRRSWRRRSAGRRGR